MKDPINAKPIHVDGRTGHIPNQQDKNEDSQYVSDFHQEVQAAHGNNHEQLKRCDIHPSKQLYPYEQEAQVT